MRLLRPLGVLLLAVALLAIASTAGAAQPVARTAALRLSAPMTRAHTFALPRGTTHFAVYWRGPRSARISVRLAHGVRFGRALRVVVDDLGRRPAGATTYGTVMLARGARAVSVRADRRLARLYVLAMRDRGRGTAARPFSAAAASVAQPPVILRAGWGADESLRFDSSGKETWPAAFYPVQKVIVHHTDTQNGDPDPAATVRSIYYYHAITQGWGDIGYNFLIDEQGNVYEGRHSLDPPSSSPPGENAQGYGVTAAHAYGYNSGTVGIALLGTLTNQDATPAARSALEQLLAWEADRHHIDPQGSALYVNPVNGTQATFPNIAGHRDVGSTECPGGVFYATLPSIRSDVAAMLASSSPPPPTTTAPTATTRPATSVTKSAATLNGSVNPNGAATTYRFEYGTSTTYGSATGTQSAGSGTAAVAVSARLGGLRRATTYHFRVVALDAAGHAYPGADATFRTSG